MVLVTVKDSRAVKPAAVFKATRITAIAVPEGVLTAETEESTAVLAQVAPEYISADEVDDAATDPSVAVSPLVTTIENCPNIAEPGTSTPAENTFV